MGMKRFAGQTGVLSILLWTLGCGPGGPKTYTITGTVTFDAHPVEKGEIVFVPLEKDQAPDAGMIQHGHYSVPVKAGHKRVEIRATREVPEKRNPMGPVFQAYIP
jgi:hypothetical protein